MNQLCTFLLGPHACALDVTRVREVIRPVAPTPVPRAPQGVVGLLSLRGQILTAYDLGPRLGLRPRTEARYGIVLEDRVCLLVDEVGEVGDLNPGQLEPPPASLDAALEDLVEAAYRGPRRLFLVLSPTGVKP